MLLIVTTWHQVNFPDLKMYFFTAMPLNKNALLRYKTIDRCLRNPYRRWTLDDLVDACSDALYEMEGITRGVSVRTVQSDIQMMRSDKLGYNAPIEVYDNKYYRYEDTDYSITETPIADDTYRLVVKAVSMIRHKDDTNIEDIGDILEKVSLRLNALLIHQ